MTGVSRMYFAPMRAPRRDWPGPSAALDVPAHEPDHDVVPALDHGLLRQDVREGNGRKILAQVRQHLHIALRDRLQHGLDDQDRRGRGVDLAAQQCLDPVGGRAEPHELHLAWIDAVLLEEEPAEDVPR